MAQRVNGRWRVRRILPIEAMRKLEGEDTVGMNVDPADSDAADIYGEECNEDMLIGNVGALVKHLRPA